MTRAGTVRGLLHEAGVTVSRGDLVSPPLGAHLQPGARIIVEHARTVRVHADGDVRSIRTHASTPLGVVRAAGIAVGAGDRVAVDGQAWPLDRQLSERSSAARSDDLGLVASTWPVAADRSMRGRGIARLPEAPITERSPSPLKGRLDQKLIPPTEDVVLIDVLRPAHITVVEDGILMNVRLTGRTVGDALQAAGLHLWQEDELFPDAQSLLSRTSRIRIQRALPFSVQADGETLNVRALADTVGEALAVAGVPLLGRDYSIPPAESPLRSRLEVQVIRVVEDFLVRQVDIPYGTETEPDPSLQLDEKRVLRPGELGSKSQRIRIVYEDGEEISRELVEETHDLEPVAQRIAYGTKIVWNTVQTEGGPKRYWRKLRVYATSYSKSRAGTPTWVPWFGLTRLGWPMRHGIIAVDPRIIPLRTEMFVPEYGLGIAGDTGGGIKQYHIDLGYDDDNYQGWHWWVEAYLLEPLPPADQIPWILP